MSPACTISMILFEPAPNRGRCGPTIKMRPLRSAISINSSHSADEEAIGFSMNVCLPASRLALARGKVMLDRRSDDHRVQANAIKHVIEVGHPFDVRIQGSSCA